MENTQNYDCEENLTEEILDEEVSSAKIKTSTNIINNMTNTKFKTKFSKLAISQDDSKLKPSSSCQLLKPKGAKVSSKTTKAYNKSQNNSESCFSLTGKLEYDISTLLKQAIQIRKNSANLSHSSGSSFDADNSEEDVAPINESIVVTMADVQKA
ncbi:unnamed protein product [Moneuplotes crassus]|uniref:Uncharacterized protein n=1 Tax=Euplotes crassus TaxID=5936 RepID=A0AAD2D5X7_EUPCR|nr:unnamed protein product [Moneuplotes crassus]